MMRQLGLLLLMTVLLIATWAVITPVRHKPTNDGSKSLATTIDSTIDSALDSTHDSTHGSNKISAHTNAHPSTKPVTFQQVSEKSQDALITTAAYVRQEKDKLRAQMSVTIRKLDQEIARLQAAQASLKAANAENTGSLHQRLVDLQGAKQSVLQLQSSLPASTQATWNRIKANWNRIEPDINARIQS